MGNPPLKHDRLKARAQRARAQVFRPCTYSLGRGGMKPGAASPTDDRGRCDCSGFAAWCLGVSRLQGDKKKPWSKVLAWIETSMVYRDATKTGYMFREIAEPVEGCVVVYGDRLGKQGHIGLVVTRPSYPGLWTIDCSTGRGNRAIGYRPLAWWRDPKRKAVFAVLKEDLA